MREPTEQKLATIPLQGRFVRFFGGSLDKPKQICVATPEGEFLIKLSKSLQKSVAQELTPGEWVQVSVQPKIKKGSIRLKAESLQVANLGLSSNARPCNPVAPQKTKDCIMVCQKSSCCKRGATQVAQAITQSLQAKGLDDQVSVKGTGCMKDCKKGPCVVFMPDKSRYVGVDSHAVPKLIEKHFADKLNPVVTTG